GGTDGPCLDVARSVVVSCAPLAAAGGRVSTQEWWEAARGGGLHRRCTPTRPAVRASPGMKGPRGCHASPLVQAFLPLWRSTGEPAIFIRSGQVHGRWLGLGNVRANGHPNSGPWRQLHCTACQGYFPAHHGTICHGKQAEVELIVRVLACLAEGLGMRATARVFEVAPNTVLHWLIEAAEQLTAFSAYFLCDLHLQQLQLDELYAVLSAVKD